MVREFGDYDLDFVKQGAYVSLDALYRGSTLHYNFHLSGLNDLKQDYGAGHFIVQFQDIHGFILHSTTIATGDLTGLVGSDTKTVQGYSTNGEAPLEQSGITIWYGGGREADAGAAVRPTAGKVLDQSSTVHIRRILHDDIYTIPKEELPDVCIGSR